MAKKTTKSTNTLSTQQPPGVPWPSDLFKSQGQYISEPIDLIPDQIIISKKFFSSKQCSSLLSTFDQLEMESFVQRGSRYYAARFNDRFTTQDQLFARMLFEYLIPRFPQFKNAKGLNPNIRVYRYTEGHHFGKHVDESVDTPLGKTTWTLLIYLSGDMIGGETVFYENFTKNAISVKPEPGLCLLHRHGKGCLDHEAMEVTKGVKWVLRSDLVV